MTVVYPELRLDAFPRGCGPCHDPCERVARDVPPRNRERKSPREGASMNVGLLFMLKRRLRDTFYDPEVWLNR